MSDPSVKECPSCHGHVRRIISGGTGLIFRGSGYYLTDYKNEKPTSKEKYQNRKMKQIKKKRKTHKKCQLN